MCWLVCLLARLHTKLQVDLAEIFREGSTWPNLEVIRFWWWFGSASGYTIGLKDSLPLWDRANAVAKCRIENCCIKVFFYIRHVAARFLADSQSVWILSSRCVCYCPHGLVAMDFSCQSFFLSMITHEPLHAAWWNFAGTCALTIAWNPENFKVIGQRSRSQPGIYPGLIFFLGGGNPPLKKSLNPPPEMFGQH